MVVELLKDAPDPDTLPAGAERRRSRRHPVTLPATLQPAGDTSPDSKIDVTVHNVSLHGAGLRSNVPLPIGDTCTLDIGAGPLNLHARVKIASLRKRRDGAWDLGVAFF